MLTRKKVTLADFNDIGIRRALNDLRRELAAAGIAETKIQQIIDERVDIKLIDIGGMAGEFTQRLNGILTDSGNTRELVIARINSLYEDLVSNCIN